ncbi:TRAP transporter large permease subunit [Paenibacillus sp. JMULE4]|nr:TRAP transporter large permease subunit [Paenibacillus sp. JMULE4]
MLGRLRDSDPQPAKSGKNAPKLTWKPIIRESSPSQPSQQPETIFENRLFQEQLANIPGELTAMLVPLMENKLLLLMAINLVVFLVGTAMDLTPTVLILTPVLMPIITAAGLTFENAVVRDRVMKWPKILLQ